MRAFQITEIKNFMRILLGSGAFDSFLLAEASITTGNTFLIDGHMVKEFFEGDTREDLEAPLYEFAEWSAMRPLCFELIRGKRTPVGFKFVLHLKPEPALKLLQDHDIYMDENTFKAFVLNIKYDGSMLTCITATAFYTFSLDKTADQLWDDHMARFLADNAITYEEP